jgi:hypothetical protein
VNPRDRRNRGTPTHVDENFVALQDFIIDHDSAGRLKASMALDDRTIFKSSQRFLYAAVRPSGNFILACFNTLHIDAHIAIDNKTIVGASASNMGRVRAGNERLCRYASRIHTGATKLVAFDNGDCHARGRKPRSQRRAGLAGPDDDGIEMSRHEGPPSERKIYHHRDTESTEKSV